MRILIHNLLNNTKKYVARIFSLLKRKREGSSNTYALTTRQRPKNALMPIVVAPIETAQAASIAIPILRDRFIHRVRRSKVYQEALPIFLAIALGYFLSEMVLQLQIVSAVIVAALIYLFICLINLRLGFLIWLLIGPFTVGRNYDVAFGLPSITFDRMALLLLITMVAARKAIERVQGQKIKIDQIDILMAIFLSITIFFAIFPPYKDISYTKDIMPAYWKKILRTNSLQMLLDHYILSFMTFFVARYVFSDEKWLWRTIIAIIIFPFILAPLAVFEHTTGKSFWEASGELKWQDIGKGRASGPFGVPTGLGIVVGTAWIFALYTVYRTRSKFLKFTCISSAFLAAVATFFTYTRGAWITVAMRLLLYGFSSKRVRKSFAIIIIGTAILISANWPTISRSETWTKRMGVKQTFDSRVTTAYSLWKMFLHKPWTGYGVQRYMHYQHQFYYRVKGYILSKSGITVSHNTYLGLLVDVGILGFIPYMLIFVITAYRAVVAYKSLPEDAPVFNKDLILALSANIASFLFVANNHDFRYMSHPEYLNWITIAGITTAYFKALEIPKTSLKVENHFLGSAPELTASKGGSL